MVSLLALPLAAQDAAPAAKNRRELMTKLANDVASARANATFDDAQKKKFDTAMEGLQKAVAARGKKKGGGERPDREQTRASIKSIYELAQTNAFKDEDRKKVQDDLAAIREFRRAQQKQN